MPVGFLGDQAVALDVAVERLRRGPRVVVRQVALVTATVAVPALLVEHGAHLAVVVDVAEPGELEPAAAPAGGSTRAP
jgi:hypothetical protein